MCYIEISLDSNLTNPDNEEVARIADLSLKFYRKLRRKIHIPKMSDKKVRDRVYRQFQKRFRAFPKGSILVCLNKQMLGKGIMLEKTYGHREFSKETKIISQTLVEAWNALMI